jgi:hypothetical protein
MAHATVDGRPKSEPETGNQHRNAIFTERRAVGRALSCWDHLRKSKQFPSRADYLEIFDEDLTKGVIVIEFTPQEEDDRIVECGPLFRNAYGRDPVGLAAKSVLPSATERGLIFWRVAAEMRKPIADVGEFTNRHGENVLYRSVFLPISEDGKRITHLMAAFSYKTVH